MEERLQKIIAAAGIASRREAEQMILDGRVTLNGKPVTELGVRANPQIDRIEVDGKVFGTNAPKIYVLLYKPKGYTTTRKDPHAKQTVMELIQRVPVPVHPVGRLDVDTEGLLILTNDGSFTYKITHPSHEVDKTYEAWVSATISDRGLQKLREGVELDDGKTAPAQVKLLRKSKEQSLIRVTIHEGRKRQVRRMIAAVGHTVLELTRTRIGPIGIGDLKPGRWRYLAPEEIAAIEENIQPIEPKRASQARRIEAQSTLAQPGRRGSGSQTRRERPR
jgi:pseudouridine synthase